MNERLWVKICGLTTAEGVHAAVKAQVDAIGFVFAPSSRRVTPQRAAEISAQVPQSIQRFAVFQHPEQCLVDEVCEVLKPDVVQTDIADLATLKLPETVRSMAVIRAGSALPSTLPRVVLFEGPRSGTGETADWTQAELVARRTKLILAGGLHPDNVADAVRDVYPYGVDVSSGVESAPGIKDPELIMRFVTAARDARDVLII